MNRDALQYATYPLRSESCAFQATPTEEMRRSAHMTLSPRTGGLSSDFSTIFHERLRPMVATHSPIDMHATAQSRPLCPASVECGHWWCRIRTEKAPHSTSMNGAVRGCISKRACHDSTRLLTRSASPPSTWVPQGPPPATSSPLLHCERCGDAHPRHRHPSCRP